MAGPSIGKMIQAVAGVSPRGLLSQYGFEAAAAICAVAGVVVLLNAVWVEMAAAWGPQPARLVMAGALVAVAVAAHFMAERRRRESEAEAERTRAELVNRLGVAQAFIARRSVGLAPLAAFAGAFLLARRL